MSSRLLAILGGLFSMISLAAAVGLGVWGWSLNNQLAQTHADYESLKTSNSTLQSDLATTKADLAAARAQTAGLQGQLKQAQDDNQLTDTKISAIKAKVSILYTWEFGSEVAMDARVRSAKDDRLTALWATWEKTRSQADALKLSDYIVQSIADAAGVTGMVPSLVGDEASLGSAAHRQPHVVRYGPVPQRATAPRQRNRPA